MREKAGRNQSAQTTVLRKDLIELRSTPRSAGRQNIGYPVTVEFQISRE